MPFLLIILLLAEEVLGKAFKWYEKQLPGLGGEFVPRGNLDFMESSFLKIIFSNFLSLYRSKGVVLFELLIHFWVTLP